MKWELERYPKYKETYIRAFDRMVAARKEFGLYQTWKNGEEVMAWWIGDKKLMPENQLVLLEFMNL